MGEKSSSAFRTISEAASELGLPQHILRQWEDTFGAIRPMRRAGGRRYYRPQDLELIAGVHALLHGERYSTKGVQKIFKDRGASFVTTIGSRVMSGQSLEMAVESTETELRPLPDHDDALRPVIAALRDAKSAIRALRHDVQNL